jgi:hypothetical protein
MLVSVTPCHHTYVFHCFLLSIKANSVIEFSPVWSLLLYGSWFDSARYCSSVMCRYKYKTDMAFWLYIEEHFLLGSSQAHRKHLISTPNAFPCGYVANLLPSCRVCAGHLWACNGLSDGPLPFPNLENSVIKLIIDTGKDSWCKAIQLMIFEILVAPGVKMLVFWGVTIYSFVGR